MDIDAAVREAVQDYPRLTPVSVMALGLALRPGVDVEQYLGMIEHLMQNAYQKGLNRGILLVGSQLAKARD